MPMSLDELERKNPSNETIKNTVLKLLQNDKKRIYGTGNY